MRKKMLTYLLVGMTALSMTGCSGKTEEAGETAAETAAETEESKETQEADNSSEEEETGDAETSQTDQRDEEIIKLLGKYVDIDAYKAEGGRVQANASDEISDEIQVDGQALKIGMSYQEVIDKGFAAADEAFKDTETNALAYTSEFKTPDDHAVTLGFIGEEGQTVEEGVLYSVKVSYLEGEENLPSFEVMGVNEGAKIQDIIDTLGEPYYLEDPAWSDFLNAGLQYECLETSRYLTFYVNLETEEPVTVTLEGYAE